MNGFGTIRWAACKLATGFVIGVAGAALYHIGEYVGKITAHQRMANEIHQLYQDGYAFMKVDEFQPKDQSPQALIFFFFAKKTLYIMKCKLREKGCVMKGIKLIAGSFIGVCVIAGVGSIAYFAGKISSNKKLVAEICKTCYKKQL